MRFFSSFRLWLVWRYLFRGRGIFNLHSLLSILAMGLGVGSLVVAMAIVSGYESTLRGALMDSYGHLVALKRGDPLRNVPGAMAKIESVTDGFVSQTPFLLIEAIGAHSGVVHGVIIEGVDQTRHGQVVALEKHLVKGEYSLERQEVGPGVLIGKSLARRLKLDVSDEFNVIVPVTDRFGGDRFRPRRMKVKVTGLLDMGRHDFDERFIVMDLAALQEFGKLGAVATGVRIKVKNPEAVDQIATEMMTKLGPDYVVRTWIDTNRNLFDAIDFEKPILFLIIGIIVLAAGFSVAGSLYVTVLRRYRDMSVLKTLGADQKTIQGLFSLQGLLVGFFGALVGLILGAVACVALTRLQDFVTLFPPDVYRIDHVKLEIRWRDVGAIFMLAMLVCWVASWAPARRGSRFEAVEGLRYE
jgi:lipoprotein-releasing system permease protein